jgi:hypothetical protein
LYQANAENKVAGSFIQKCGYQLIGIIFFQYVLVEKRHDHYLLCISLECKVLHPAFTFLSLSNPSGWSKQVALLLVMDQEQTMQNLSGQQKENQPFSLDPPKWLS